MTHTPQNDRKLTFEQQQELNYIRDTAMRIACEGLTTKQLKELNAKLIAAAPDLLEACEVMMKALSVTDWRTTGNHALALMRAAISKAE